MTAPVAAAGRSGRDEQVLAVRGLGVTFGGVGGARVVTDVSWDLHRGETLAIVGESGSGKTVSTLALTRLVPEPPGRVSGEVRLDGEDLLSLDPESLRRVRGRRIGMVFQDPQTSLHPMLTIGRQLTEHVRLHLGLDRAGARERAVELLELVGLPGPRAALDSHPHQLSGGMRQRIGIAMGLACEPDVLVADEPTTALDVTIQAQIIELVGRLQAERGMAVVWITHDLAVVAGIADRVVVMYAGYVVEEAPVARLYADPAHPYTRALLASIPRLGTGPSRLDTIPGLPPDPAALPPGCPFHPRCPEQRDDRCATEVPPLRREGEHRVRCFYRSRAS